MTSFFLSPTPIIMPTGFPALKDHTPVLSYRINTFFSRVLAVMPSEVGGKMQIVFASKYWERSSIQKGSGGRRCVRTWRWGAKSTRGLEGQPSPPPLRRRRWAWCQRRSWRWRWGWGPTTGRGWPAWSSGRSRHRRRGRGRGPGRRGGGATTGGAPSATPSARYAASWRDSRRRSLQRGGSAVRRWVVPPRPPPPEPVWRWRRHRPGNAAGGREEPVEVLERIGIFA